MLQPRQILALRQTELFTAVTQPKLSFSYCSFMHSISLLKDQNPGEIGIVQPTNLFWVSCHWTNGVKRKH